MVRKSMMFSNAKVDVTIYHYASVIRQSLPVRTSGIRGAVQCVTNFLRLLWSSTVYTCGDMEPIIFYDERQKVVNIDVIYASVFQ